MRLDALKSEHRLNGLQITEQPRLPRRRINVLIYWQRALRTSFIASKDKLLNGIEPNARSSVLGVDLSANFCWEKVSIEGLGAKIRP